METKRGIVLALAGLWIVALAMALFRSGTGMVRALPGLLPPPAVRAEVESGDAPYHRFLLRVAGAAGEEPHLLLLSHDPTGNHLFQFYRAAYRLYPARVWFVPVGFSPPPAGRFSLSVGEEQRRLIAEKPVRVAALYEQPAPEASVLYRIAAAGGGRVEFAPLPGPAAPAKVGSREMPAAPGYGSPRPAAWLLGLASLLLFGLAFNRASGLDRAFEGDRASGWTFAFFTGAGLTAWALLVLSLAGVRWSLPVAVVPGAGVLVWAGMRWWRRREVPPAGPAASGPPLEWPDRAGVGLLALSVAIALGHAVAPLSAWSNWDAWAIWFLKTRACWVARGVPFDYLRDQIFAFSHLNYPLGLPVLNSYLALWTGELDARFLRATSPVYHLALGCLIARLLAELGVARGRWLAAGAFSLIPLALEQGFNGYADLPVSCGMVATLLVLVMALSGRAPVWAVGLMGGLAALVKDEGALWGAVCLAVVGLQAVRRRLRFAPVAAAALIFLALAGPWKATTRSLGLRPKDYVVDAAAMLRNLPARAPLVARAAVLESLGPGLTLPRLVGSEGFSLPAWFNQVRGKWLLLWYTVAAAVVVGFRRLLTPPFREAALVVLLQASAYGSVYLGSVKEVPWHLVTSLDRLLLQLAPAAWALACALLATEYTKYKVKSTRYKGHPEE